MPSFFKPPPSAKNENTASSVVCRIDHSIVEPSASWPALAFVKQSSFPFPFPLSPTPFHFRPKHFLSSYHFRPHAHVQSCPNPPPELPPPRNSFLQILTFGSRLPSPIFNPIHFFFFHQKYKFTKTAAATTPSSY